jgi:hypothetical protein
MYTSGTTRATGPPLSVEVAEEHYCIFDGNFKLDLQKLSSA